MKLQERNYISDQISTLEIEAKKKYGLALRIVAIELGTNHAITSSELGKIAAAGSMREAFIVPLIFRECECLFAIPYGEIAKRTRKIQYVKARAMAVFFITKHLGVGQERLGIMLDNRDHSSIHNALKAHDSLMLSNAHYRKTCTATEPVIFNIILQYDETNNTST